jgi:hypothetical protein
MINDLSLSHTHINSPSTCPTHFLGVPLLAQKPAYHLSHAGFEPLSVQPSSASLVHILVSQRHETTGRTMRKSHSISLGSYEPGDRH